MVPWVQDSQSFSLWFPCWQELALAPSPKYKGSMPLDQGNEGPWSYTLCFPGLSAQAFLLLGPSAWSEHKEQRGAKTRRPSRSGSEALKFSAEMPSSRAFDEIFSKSTLPKVDGVSDVHTQGPNRWAKGALVVHATEVWVLCTRARKGLCNKEQNGGCIEKQHKLWTRALSFKFLPWPLKMLAVGLPRKSKWETSRGNTRIMKSTHLPEFLFHYREINIPKVIALINLDLKPNLYFIFKIR